MAVETSATPLMQQYYALKGRHPEEILLFRLGDFYEMFADDAQRAAPILDVALTHRQQTPMCGVPYHAVDTYVARLLKAGLRVAIADQMEDPATTKGLVKRDVVRVMTPGTLQEETLLSSKRSNFLAAICANDAMIGLAALESSTGEFLATEIPRRSTLLWDELMRLAPSEVIVPPDAGDDLLRGIEKQGISIASLPPADFAVPLAEERLKKIFGTRSLRGYGLEGRPQALSAAGAVVRYLENTQCGRPCNVQPLRFYALDDYLQMDANTLEHLELVEPAGGRTTARTLLDMLDHTGTPMGGRLLRRWMVTPLRRVESIHARQSRVEEFVLQPDARRALRAALQGWPDMERILTRLVAGTVLPRDLAHLAAGLRRLPELKKHGAAGLPEETALAAHLTRAVVDAPPATLKDGGVIRPGFDRELDEVQSWIHDGKSKLLELEQREREATGISSMKVGFNNVFGYYIEITRTHLAKVPAHYIRKQTTANGERYITPELKEFETKILGAQERALRRETALAQDLRSDILRRADPLRQLAHDIAELDVYLSLADVADRRAYVKPLVDESDCLLIRDGRHPVLEEVLPSGTLVPNDVELGGTEQRIVILTGPNMSGKSTYLRQTALIAILAQMGSYVPAAEAHIGVLDQLFTRIGASDRLAEGESTFMVEMVETARILHHATARSLVVLDEVGRGTSTYDGIAIAWACIEFLTERRPKVLFATHYFELTQLAGTLAGVRNAHVTAREWGDSVVFLHKVEPGPADRAYGIHVARLAGVPKSVLERAKVLLQLLEEKSASRKSADTPELPLIFNEPLSTSSPTATGGGPRNASLLDSPPEAAGNDELVSELLDLNINSLTPVDALLKLQELQTKLKRRKGD